MESGQAAADVARVRPGFYFPQWDDDQDQDFPARVHLAWELPKGEDAGLKAQVRRVTYELGSVSEGEGATRAYPWEPDGHRT
ncbi:hypothetical protein ACWDBP_34940 [Streptomyces sp. NPDC001233]|uniref:hypothetical protein n=1 Tax=Streptomyces sp. NPDC002589 TaxID=3154420 RepID=UPI0033245DA7